MSAVKSILTQKGGALIHVRSGDMVSEALRQMRDKRVRAVLVIDDGMLVGIVTLGDCAIDVLLPGLDAKQTPVDQVMTGNPMKCAVLPRRTGHGCTRLSCESGTEPGWSPLGYEQNTTICSYLLVLCSAMTDQSGFVA